MSSERWMSWSLRIVAAWGLSALVGCTAQLADLAEPADTPPRPAVQPAYPAVHAMPAARNTRPLTDEERRRISEELTNLRERQEAETTGSLPDGKPAAR